MAAMFNREAITSANRWTRIRLASWSPDHRIDVTAGGRGLDGHPLLEKSMASKLDWRAATFAACVTLAAVCGTAQAQEVPVVTGDHWTKSTEQMKKVYLIGVANAVQVEVAFAGNNPAPDTQTVLPRMAKGMKGQTLDSVREGLDRWYAANPDKLARPVLETIWFEMVVPGLKKP
jgi:hypothetical protein